ncbi:penicillin-binding protein 1C [Zobellia galactanivorans]|uniref:penicillin-binding protein 1C n=1 Tax=Zobellia galactanivorans (strain DSM 12802 / CCUG 47099 / CIP 106680 / NCIMB 13871 / Dsij) TaxID=63186 RepID=UPI0026E16E46|nr:penicillin-binding protein 1C [Zobellia galactanivorans]MDO6808288.1 penicillin-binding protein 1C [Zobellia galactanivorans]
MKGLIQFFKRHPIKLTLLFVAVVAYYFCLPRNLFDVPTATVVESRQGSLLGARIADDGQWRFPVADSVPEKFEQCILLFEDAHFYEHFGFNPISMLKALRENVARGKVVRGGSTLTQQVVRLSRGQKKRSYFEKLIELVLATRLEIRESKRNILKLYCGHAPFGGNVVGLEMAAWRYFGLRPYQLSWAESATLAVLPNAPGLIYPGRNQDRLLKKRNRLLKKLFDNMIIDRVTYDLSLLEPLPAKPFSLPDKAPHLVQYMSKTNKGKRMVSSVDEKLQQHVNAIVKKHHANLKQNQVHNAAVMVVDVHTRKVLSYVGNTPTDAEHQKDVDMVRANRSTGSVLKPLLYAAMLDAGELLPDMLVADVPTQIAGYTPENFSENYSGAVAAKKALARSLNIPAVRLLQAYGLEKFRDQLDVFKLGGITKSADHYGLTLILGGAESNLWDLCKTYANLAGTLNHFNATSSEYYTGEFTDLDLKTDATVDYGKKSLEKTVFDAASIYLTFEAMKEVNRPEGDESWQFFDSSKEIAWKTGTSFGNKDAWAIGVTTDHVVGVWVGNADGEGRPNVSGVSSAAPLMFDVFDVLPRSQWFQKPFDEFTEINVCAESGYLATDLCQVKRISIPNKENYVSSCPYHQMVHLNAQRQFQVNSSCADVSNIVSEPWFVLPPLMAYYYRSANPSYRELPPFQANCRNDGDPPMQFIYPKNGSRITLAKNFEGKTNELVVKLAHIKAGADVYWYLDETFVGQTHTFHEIALLPKKGRHKIMALDGFGNEVFVTITIE